MTQNISSQLVAFNDKLFQFLQSKGLDQEVAIQNAKDEHSISDSKNLQKALDEVNNVDRLLRVGIIGRVKAGKSSLLNALIFDGKDILPKAATPMTAALTRMEYSEDVRAEVEFYDQADLNQIEENSRRYEQMFDAQKSARLSELAQENELMKKQHRQSEIRSEKELQQLAEDHARSAVEKSVELAAAHDQYQRIKQAKVQLSDLQAHSNIKATSTSDLMGKLNDYVGSNGKYMPFTKSVKLYIPEEGLKGLEIVDTPGVNDPVQSREQRTNEFLKQCDVVLVVSPAGQFISEEDMALMGRVTAKEGIQEAYLIASQVDGQLFGSAKENDYSLDPVVRRITQKLSEQAKTVFAHNTDETMKKVIELYKKHDVICTSSVAYTMLQNFNQQNQWDENTQHVWANLKKHYPDVFNNPTNSKDVLEKLSNIVLIKQIFEDVKSRKHEIQAEKRQALVKSTIKSYNAFLLEISDYIENRVDDIESKDLDEERQKLKEFEEQRDDCQDLIDTEYRRAVLDFSTLQNTLFEILDRETQGFTKMNEVRETTRQEEFNNWRYASDSIFSKVWGALGGEREREWYKDYRTVHEDVINAGQVTGFIRDIRDTISTKLAAKHHEFRKEWEDELVRTIFAGMRQIHAEHQNSARLGRKQVNSIIQNVFNNMPRAHFTVRDTLPSSLKQSGTLKNASAHNFVRDAQDYMFEKFKPDLRQDIIQFMSNTEDTLKNQAVSQLILDKLEKEIAGLIHEIENKEESIARYKLIKMDLAALQKEVPTM